MSYFSDQFYLWVELDAPGTWYADELHRLTSCSSKLVISPPGVTPEPVDFPQPHNLLTQSPIQDIFRLPDCRPSTPISMHPSVLRVLRTLARLERAQTLEIASLAGFGKSYTHTLLQKLVQLGYTHSGKVWRYPGWILTHSGLRQAHLSWNLPPKLSFRRYRREHSRAGPRHRRIARLWRAWLEEAFPYHLKVWDCWTEFAMHPGFPDALAWGVWQGQETLFWLEVDTGHASEDELRSTYRTRYHRALIHAAQVNIPTVFVLLSMPWVLRAVVPIFNNISDKMAVIAEDWRRFGELPVPEFGRCRVDFELMKERLPDLRLDPKRDWSHKFEGMGKD